MDRVADTFRRHRMFTTVVGTSGSVPMDMMPSGASLVTMDCWRTTLPSEALDMEELRTMRGNRSGWRPISLTYPATTICFTLAGADPG